MNSEYQAIAALVVVLGALSYLTRRWWKNRQKISQGCGGGECACPSTQLPGKPQR